MPNLHYCHLQTKSYFQEKIPKLAIFAFCLTGKGGIYWGECKSVAQRPNPKSLTGGDKVDSGKGLPMENVLDSTLEWT